MIRIIEIGLATYTIGNAIVHTSTFIKWVWNMGNMERRSYITAHVKDRHTPKLRYCEIDNCRKLADY